MASPYKLFAAILALTLALGSVFPLLIRSKILGSDYLPYILVACGILAVYGLFFIVCRFLSTRKGVRFATLIFLLSCGLAFALANLLLSGHDFLWKGFVLDHTCGWYPTKELNGYVLEAKAGNYYSASTDELGHRISEGANIENAEMIFQGDSTLWGFNLANEETLPAILNREHQYKAYNMGVPGYDLNNIYFQYEKHRELVADKARVIWFNANNDFLATFMATTYHIKRPHLYFEGDEVVKRTDYANAIPFQAYGNHYNKAYAQYDYLKANNDGYDWAWYAPRWSEHFPLILFAFYKCYPIWINIAGQEAPTHDKPRIEWALLEPYSSWPEPYAQMARDMKRWIALFKAQSGSLTLVYFPSTNEVSSYKQEAHESGLHALMREACEANDVPFISLTDPLSQAAESIEIFQPNDSHPTETALQISAQVIAEYMQQ